MMKQFPPVPFLFVRHGQTDWNKEQRLMGHTDIPLNQEGRSQAYSLHHTLKNLNIRQIYYSSLLRAQETASIINEVLHLPMHPLDELKEWHWGELEEIVPDQTSQGKPQYREKTLLQWRNDPQTIKAEPQEAFFNRITSGLNNVLLNNNLSLIVSHGGVFWGFCQILNCPHETLDNCLPLLFKPCFLDTEHTSYGWEIEPLKLIHAK